MLYFSAGVTMVVTVQRWLRIEYLKVSHLGASLLDSKHTFIAEKFS